MMNNIQVLVFMSAGFAIIIAMSCDMSCGISYLYELVQFLLLLFLFFVRLFKWNCIPSRKMIYRFRTMPHNGRGFQIESKRSYEAAN